MQDLSNKFYLKTKRSLSKRVLSKRPLGNLQGGGRGHLVGYLLHYKYKIY